MVARHGVLALVAGLACLAGGCTTPAEPDPTGVTTAGVGQPAGDTGSPVTGSPTPRQGDIQQGTWVTEMVPPPPLAAYGVYLDGPGEDPATLADRAQRHQDIENALAACMAAQGFPYVPTPLTPDPTAARRSLAAGLRYLPVPRLPADRESAVRQGYGVMASIDEQWAAEGWSNEDPNSAYTATLGPAEYEAYYAALSGDYHDPTTITSSCSGQVAARYPQQDLPDRQQEFLAEFGDLADAVRTAMVDMVYDPRAVQLDAEWETCMAGKGYTFEPSPDDYGPRSAMDLALRTRPDGTVGPAPDGFINLSDIPVEEKSLLGTEPERQVALADFDCRAETDYLDRLTQIQMSIDEQFLADHQGELDRLVVAAEGW
jgi:hypothetical protein